MVFKMKTVKGNLVDMFLNGEFKVMIHGANCFKSMGAGIAGEIRNKIPEAVIADNLYGISGDKNKLSNWSLATVRRKTGGIGVVINLYTQYNPGKDLYEEALILGFKKLAPLFSQEVSIGIPAIGCGIAGGNWEEISPKIAKIFKNHNITFVEYDDN